MKTFKNCLLYNSFDFVKIHLNSINIKNNIQEKSFLNIDFQFRIINLKSCSLEYYKSFFDLLFILFKRVIKNNHNNYKDSGKPNEIFKKDFICIVLINIKLFDKENFFIFN